MIPKKIHYCWFGRNPKPKLAVKCIESWKKFCSDYEIIEWNEDNFDINMNAYTRMCYEEKKYAFLSDYVRLKVILEYGGIYLDTDVEVVRTLDKLLENKAFFGFENDLRVATGLGFGAERENEVVLQMLREYDELLDGKHGTLGCTRLNTNALLKYGLQRNGELQVVNNVIIYPQDYFNPLNSITGVLNKTDNTYTIHWYAMSWLSPGRRLRSYITKYFHRIFGERCFEWLKHEK